MESETLPRRADAPRSIDLAHDLIGLKNVSIFSLSKNH